jgi:hypothetical protein
VQLETVETVLLSDDAITPRLKLGEIEKLNLINLFTGQLNKLAR